MPDQDELVEVRLVLPARLVDAADRLAAGCRTTRSAVVAEAMADYAERFDAPAAEGRADG